MKMNALLEHLDLVHTTAMGVERIKKNLDLQTADVVEHCKALTTMPNSLIEKRGKNWYVTNGNVVVTINASSYTIITAHKVR